VVGDVVGLVVEAAGTVVLASASHRRAESTSGRPDRPFATTPVELYDRVCSAIVSFGRGTVTGRGEQPPPRTDCPLAALERAPPSGLQRRRRNRRRRARWPRER